MIKHRYHDNIRRLPLYLMTAIVILVGMGVGAFFGAWADSVLGMGTRASEKTKWFFQGRWVFNGLAFGLTAGALAGVVWSRQFIMVVKTSLRPNRLMRRSGTLWGTIVGTFAGAVVYIWLKSYLLIQERDMDLTPGLILWLALACILSALVGAITGYLCSWLGYGAARMALPLPPVNPKQYQQRPI